MASTISRAIPILADLNKLTARELKLLCKERNITGYSKLPKTGIIEKLLDWQKKQPTQNTGSAAATPQVSLQNKDIRPSLHLHSTPETLSVQFESPFAKAKDCPSLKPANPEPLALQSLGQQRNLTSGAVQRTTEAYLKRPRSKGLEAIAEEATKKKRRIHDELLAVSTVSNVSSAPLKATPGIECKKHNGTQVSGRRYKALIPSRKLPAPKTPMEPLLRTGESFDTLSDYLDLVLEGPLPHLQPISLPPSVAQRRHVPRLSLLLSYISVNDLRACTLVSRLFRYSGGNFSVIRVSSLFDTVYSIYGRI